MRSTGDDRAARSVHARQRHAAAIEGIVRRMRAGIAAPSRLGEMADSVGMSPFHFDRVFRGITGLSAGAFQAALRIDAAKRLLLVTDTPVTDICFDLGYESLGSFTSRFRAQVGISPTAFRAFAADLAARDVAGLLASAFAATPLLAGVPGTIAGATSKNAFVWIGLFRKGLPSEKPVSGRLHRGDGPFVLPPPPDGYYSALAAALEPAEDWRNYFLSGDHLRVATGGRYHVYDRTPDRPLTLELRALRETDPPILVPLPFLALGAEQSARSQGQPRGASVARRPR